MSLITCTPGGSTDNCYVTLDQADDHFANTLREDAWQAHAEAQRERALIQATAEIEALGGPKAHEDLASRPLFTGTPYDADSQALHFPRTVDTDSSGDAFITPAIRGAVIEQAFWLLDQQVNPDILDRDELQAQGVTSIGIAGHSESFTPTGRPQGICSKAWDAVRQYVMNGHVGRTRAR
jgi:hypothetical protein